MILITMTEKAKELEPILRELYDNDDFVQGVIANAKTDDNLNTIQQYIATGRSLGDEITSDEIIDLSILLSRKQKGQ